MPTVNIFHINSEIGALLKNSSTEFRQFIAQRLSCPERELQPKEISLRSILSNNLAMIAPVEVEMTAHAYPSRVEEQDKICSDVADFLKSKKIDSHVWLLLCELGHSWKD